MVEIANETKQSTLDMATSREFDERPKKEIIEDNFDVTEDFDQSPPVKQQEARLEKESPGIFAPLGLRAVPQSQTGQKKKVKKLIKEVSDKSPIEILPPPKAEEKKTTPPVVRDDAFPEMDLEDDFGSSNPPVE